MEFLFFKADDTILFSRSDAESASWCEHEMTLTALFPFVPEKEIKRGYRIGFDGDEGFQVFEIRKVRNYEPDEYQEITAEHIAISELTDCHVASGIEFSNVDARNAVSSLLTGTGWSIGNVTASGSSSGDVGMGSVWQALCIIRDNWNVLIRPRLTMNTVKITGRYLDIIPNVPVWHGVRVSINKNADEIGITYDDTELITAMYGYGGNVEVEGQEEQAPLTFSGVTWSKTSEHPAKPSGQTYIESPEATLTYGRKGRPRFGFYQNGDIKDPNILLQKTWESLKNQMEPSVTIDCLVRDLYRLGYADQPIRLNDLAIVDIEPIGVQLQRTIIQIDRDLLDDTATRVVIGTYIPNIVYINHEVAVKTGSNRGGGRSKDSKTKEEVKRQEFEAEINANNYQISLRAYQNDLSTIDSQLRQAEIKVDAQGVRLEAAEGNIRSNNTELATVKSNLNVEAGKISQIVTAVGKNGEVTSASIVTAINDNNDSTVLIKAKKIQLEGTTTATTLDARLANVDALFATSANTLSIKVGKSVTAGNVYAGNLYIGDGVDNVQLHTYPIYLMGTGQTALSGVSAVTTGSVAMMDLRHSHEITITELTGDNAGHFQVTLGPAVSTSSTDRIKNFKIADTAYYKSRVGIDPTKLVLQEIGATPYNASTADEITGIAAGTDPKYFLITATPKDGDTVYKKFVLPAAAAPAVTTDPKISKKSWASGQIQLDASSDPNDPASVTISLTGAATGSLVYGDSNNPTTPTQIKFDILESVSGSTVDTGADVVASVVRGAATIHLGTNNNAPAIVVNTPGFVTVGGQRIQVGVTALPVTPGTATPNTPTWNSSTHKYAITADGSVSIGSDSLALTRGSLSGDFTPSNAFTYAFNQCYGSIGLSEASQELNPGESVTIYPKAYSTYDVSINPNAQPQNITTKGITITAKQAATVTPKVSKKSWASGSLTFEGTTASSDPTSAGVALGWVTVPNTSNGNASLSVVDKASPYSSAQPHTVLTKDLTLTCEDDAAYLKDGGTTIAKVPNNKTADPVTVNVSKGSWSSGAIQFSTDPASGTGKNVSLGMTIPANTSNGNAQITIVDKASPGSSSQPLSTGLTKTLTLTCEDDAAYLKDGNTTVAKVPNNKTTPTVSASIDNITGSAIDDNNTRETVPISASGTNVTSRTEYAILKRDTYGSAGNKCVTLTMDGVVIGRISAQTFYIEGRNSVKITNVERVASCAFDHDAQTAEQDVRFTLSNGETYTIHEDFSDVYRAGRNGTAIDTFVDYAVDLSSGGVVFDPGVEEDADGDPLRIDLSDIYRAGQNYTPPVKHWYTYSSTGGDVPIYVRGGGSGSSDGVIGSIYDYLNQFHASTSIAFYPYTPVEVVGSLLGYTQVSYGGKTYYVDPSNLTQSETDLSIGHRIGIKDLTAYAVSTTMTGLIHTGGATSGISVYLEPYNGTAKNYTSSYVPSSDFSSYRANGNASSYFYEMAAKSGYYGRHEKTAYSGDIQHKAIFEILYSDGNTETVVVSFNSYAKAADEVVYTYPGYIDANNYVNLRSTNSTAGTVLAQVPDRSTVMCQYNPNGYTGTWMPVQYGGKTGYIQSKFIEGTKDWNDLNTKTISTITLVGVAHTIGSSSKDFTVTLRPQKNGMKFVTSYATESSEYTYNWAVTSEDYDTYLLHPISGCYMYHSKSACSSSVRMRVKLRVTYTNSSKFPAEEVVLQVTSVAK